MRGKYLISGKESRGVRGARERDRFSPRLFIRRCASAFIFRALLGNPRSLLLHLANSLPDVNMYQRPGYAKSEMRTLL